MRGWLLKPYSKVFVFAVAGLFALTSLACPPTDSNESQGRGLSKQARALFRLIPDSEYFMVGYIDLDRFSGSRFGASLVDISPSLHLWDKKLGINIESFHQLAFASKYPKDCEESPDAIILMASDLSVDQVLEMMGKKKEFFKARDYAGSRLYEGEDFSFSFPVSGIVALGSPKLVRGCLQFISSRGDTLYSGKGLFPFKEYLMQSDALWVGISGIERLLKPVIAKNTLLKIFTTLESGFIGIKFAEDADVRFYAMCQDEEQAQDIASGIQGVLGILNLLIRNEDFSEVPAEIEPERLRENVLKMLDSIDVGHQEKQINISFVVPRSLVDYVMEQVGRVMSDKEVGE